MTGDRIGDYLHQKLASTPEPHPSEARPPRRPSPTKIVALSTAALIILAAASIPLLHSGEIEHKQVLPAPPPHVASPSAPEPIGLIVLVDGIVKLDRRGSEIVPTAGDTVMTDDAIETGQASYAGISLDALLVVLGPESRLLAREHTLLETGTLGARLSDSRLDFENAAVSGRDALLTLEASGSSLQRLSVAEGEVLVTRKPGTRIYRVTRGRVLDARTWSLSPSSADDEILSRLASLEPAVPAPPSPSPRPDGLVRDIRKALAAGDLELALDLVEIEGKGRSDTDFLIAAADVYREAGKWSSAAELYTSASRAATGEEAERVLLRAAEIRLRKLDDPSTAAAILSDYLSRFPSGVYLDECLYLAAVVHSKLGDLSTSRSFYERYLDLYPSGVQATRIHVALAQILAKTDCPAALAHVEAARSKSQGPAVESELSNVESICSK